MTKKDDNTIKVNIGDSADKKRSAGKRAKTEKEQKEKKESAAKKDSKEQEYLDQLQRLQADFTNYKRRVERDWKEATMIAKADMSLKFISVIDDLERVIVHHENDEMIETQGVKMILQKCRKLLKDEGVEQIDAVGEVFDPELHAAVTVEHVDEDKDDIILEEWQKGYIFGDRLLRPSQVKVGRFQPEQGE